MFLHTGSFDSQLLDILIHDAVDLFMIQNKPRFQIDRYAHVVFNRQAAKNAVAPAVFGNQPDSRFHSVHGTFDFHLFSVYVNLTRLHTPDAENAFHELRSLGAYQTAEAQDLTLSEIKVDVLEGIGVNGTEILDLHNHFPRFISPGRIHVGQFPAHHLGDNLIRGQILRRPGSHIGSVSHNGDIICDALNLIHLMGNVNHGYALIPQIIHNAEERLHLIVGKRRCRLVKDNHPRLLGDGFRNLHGLHLPHGQTA